MNVFESHSFTSIRDRFELTVLLPHIQQPALSVRTNNTLHVWDNEHYVQQCLTASQHFKDRSLEDHHRGYIDDLREAGFSDDDIEDLGEAADIYEIYLAENQKDVV